jgi:CheY-like chemotaxis protein
MLTEVFEMFAQVDNSLERTRGGLGIGPSIARRLVEMHHGSIEARSEGPDRGSEFTVRLPVSEGAEPEPSASDSPNQPPHSGPRRRILVADDNELAASSLATLLEIMGNEVRTARDGFEAVETAAAFQPDIILMDIGMPKLNGYEACRSIRQQPWSAKAVLVAITGWGQEEARRRSQEVGFTHHMVKPVSPDALEALLGPLR